MDTQTDFLQLMSVIADVESGGNDAAMRFEPGTFARWQDAIQKMAPVKNDILGVIARVHNCDDATAAMIAATSWGRFQIMGFNLYAQGSPVAGYRVCDFLAHGSLQTLAFRDFLDRNHLPAAYSAVFRDHVSLLDFAQRYNGPGDFQAYAAAMMRAAQRLGYAHAD